MRWRSARAALWALLDRHVRDGAAVAIVGAGNGDDLPLRPLTRRAARVDLIDLDAAALRRARRRVIASRAQVRAVVEDVTGGAADAIVRRARGEDAAPVAVPEAPVGEPPYDVVVADHVATQLLYPALVDAGLDGERIDAALLRDGQPLTDAVVRRLHAAAPDGVVIHVHDLLGWWPGHAQPFGIDEVLALREDPDAALALAATGDVPYGCDPRTASLAAGAEITETTFWRWPFSPATDYLVCATVAVTSTASRRPTRASSRPRSSR